MDRKIDPATRRKLVNRMRTIVSKMDEWQNIIEQNGLWDEQPGGWQNAHQESIRWLMENEVDNREG